MTAHPDLPADGDGDADARQRERVSAETRAGAALWAADMARADLDACRERLDVIHDRLDADADDLDMLARSLADRTVSREEVASRIASVAARLRYYRQEPDPPRYRPVSR